MSDKKEEYSYTMLAKLLIVFLIVHLLAVITLILCFSSDHEVASAVVIPVSSVWCSKDTTLERRRCYFKNLCYSFRHEEFVFVRGKESVMEGIPKVALAASHAHLSVGPQESSTSTEKHNVRYSMGEALADLSGGVEGHGNRDYHFSFVEVSEAAIKEKNFTTSILPEKMLIFRRFKPDNLMHVIHDDLLPLYATLAELEHAGAGDYRIFFNDNYDEGDYWEFYRVFRSKAHLNSHHPLLKKALRTEVDKDADLACFATAAVGGAVNTKWYQYGFDRFQGPSTNRQITGPEIRAFANHFRQGLEIPKYDIDMPRYGTKVRQRHPYAVLFNRLTTRTITNEVDVTVAVSREFDLHTVAVNLETHTLAGIVHLLENATMLIGMHGAEMVLSMFLPPNSIVLELFPYGLSADHYTPYRTLAHIDGLGLLYRAWENRDPAKTRPHPEYEPEHGGFEHLPAAEQARIRDEIPVKQHRCCRDPAFLHRVYQDTEVDIASLTDLARKVFAVRAARLKSPGNGTAERPLTPAEVALSNCSYVAGQRVFHVDWEVPWNLADSTGVRYLALVQPLAGGVAREDETAEGHLEVPGDAGDVDIWIAAAVGEVVGPWTREPARCRR